MIKNQWYAVLESKEVKKYKPLGVKRFGEKLVFWRNKNNEINCLADVCCHRGAALSLGLIENDHIQCPFHGFEFDKNGICKKIPANGSLLPIPEKFKTKSYVVKEKHGFIWLWYSDTTANIPEIGFFDVDNPGFSYASYCENISVHYTRAIENQLDVLHLPFVHHNTIGKGMRTVVNGPLVTFENNDLFVFMNNEKDIGQKPLKSTEMPVGDKNKPHLHFKFPSLWQLHISKSLRMIISFVPIDEENTAIYLRYYQSFVKLPLLKNVVNAIGMIYSKIILRQDNRIVETQRPIKTELHMRENLVHGDMPIIEYRRKRDFLLKETDI